MADCIFCKIAKGEVPCYKIYEDGDYIAFLDIMPDTEGQSLVIPKRHVNSYVFDADDSDLKTMIIATKRVAKLLERKLGVKRVHLAFEGLDVPHLHAKLYPMTREGYVITPHVREKVPEAELEKLQRKITAD